MIYKAKIKKSFVVENELGLHARPAAELAKCAQNYKANIILSYAGLTADVRSVVEILMLAAGKGAEISIEGDGEEAEEALNAIIQLASQEFNVTY